jgi:hypothetical protein
VSCHRSSGLTAKISRFLPESHAYNATLQRRSSAPCAAKRALSRRVSLSPSVLLPDVMVATLTDPFLPSPLGWHECLFLEHSLQAVTQH